MRYPLRTLLIVLASSLGSPLWGQQQVDPGEALYGLWEVEEMIFKSKVQDFGGKPGEWFEISKNGFDLFFTHPTASPVNRRNTKTPLYKCEIRPGEMDIQDRFRKDQPLLKAKYELKDGKMRVAWREDHGDRPASFDEAYIDRNITLFVLKKVK
jgi:hypothetical protein